MGAEPERTPDEPSRTLVVDTTDSAAPDGGVYIEGSIAEIVLRDASGRRVAMRTVRPGATISFDGLEPGTYLLKPATRPCVGNCGALDERILPCEQTLDIDADLRVRVDFTVGSPCSIHPA